MGSSDTTHTNSVELHMSHHKRLQSLLADVELIIAAGQELNAENPDMPPIDLEVEQVVRSMAKTALAAHAKGDIEKFNRYVDKLDAYASAQKAVE